MALVLADRVLETTTTTGSGTITLAGAEPGYQAFSVIGNANQTYYTITADTDWEVGIGTYTASGTTLSRDTVLASSNSGNRITLPAGSKKVFVTYPAEKSVNLDVSGNISLSSAVISGVASPSADSDAATKLYVDTLAAQGITYHSPVKYEVPSTTGNLNATYNNGTAGVSATLTNAGTLAAFVPDGVTATISDRVLIYNQSNGFENGVYTVKTVGNGSTAWVLMRATDADTYALKSPNSLGGGDAFYVTSGNTGAGETYLCNNSGTIVFGSTAISFVQISAAQVYSAGTGISLTNTVFSLVSPVAVATGGTGTTATPTNGQLLIGNGSGYTLSTLTAGSGVSITNSAGSITLTATGSGGTVVEVKATSPLASSGGTSPTISIANSTGTGSVVLDQGATISSATITAGVSAAITTITGTSANITTVSGTTARFSSAAITQLSGTSAGITTVSGTTTTFSSGTITQFGATSATVTTISGTNVTYSNGNFTSATVTTVSGTTATYTSANITTLTGTTFGTTATTQLRGASGAITTLTGTNLSYASATITTGNLAFSGTAQRITGDMSNATHINRLSFQTSVTNGATSPFIIPNGTGSVAAITVANASDPTNCSFGQFVVVDSTEIRITSGLLGSGTYLPVTIQAGGSERVRLTTTGLFGIGKTPTTMLDVSGTITGINGAFTSANITTLTGTTATYTSATITTLKSTSATIDTIKGTSASITTITGSLVGNASTATSATSATTATTATNQSGGTVSATTGTFSSTLGVTGRASLNGGFQGTVARGSYGSVSLYGSLNSYSGIDINDQSVTWMTNSSAVSFGAYKNNNAWAFYFDMNGVLQVGTVPGGSVTGAVSSATTATNVSGGGQISAASGTITTLTSTSANITTLTGTTLSDGAGNVRNIPSAGADKTSVYTLAITDIGEYVGIGTGGGIDVPNGIFSTGNAISIFNNTTGNRTISLTITTAYIAGTDADKNSVTLATRGLATILFLSNSVCVISGNVT